MNASEWKDKMTGAIKGFSIKKAWNFVKKNVRYFTAGALFVVLVLILARCMGTSPGQKDGTEALTEASTQQGYTAYQVDAVTEVNQLITNYYAAYADGNIKELKKYAKPLTKNERSYIRMFSEYVENYQNIKCYTKPGLDDKSYLVSAYVEIKFKDVDTLAPGLDFFYVTTNKDGELYINNRYSQFNLLNKEKELDPEIEALIESFELEDDVVALQQEVQKKFEEVSGSDEKLAQMINGTIKDACAQWAQKIAAAQSTEQTTEQATEQSSETATEQTPQQTEDLAEIVYTTDIVNIRAQADENGELVTTVPAGTALTRTGNTDNGWSKLDYNNKDCYVKSEYLSTEAPQDQSQDTAQDQGQDTTAQNTDTGTQDTTGLAEGTEVLLSDTVNVRASMSADAEKVGTAFAGEKVTVVMSYAEGWTKVNWNGQTGYIKTEFLK